jgi:hypothetical protein
LDIRPLADRLAVVKWLSFVDQGRMAMSLVHRDINVSGERRWPGDCADDVRLALPSDSPSARMHLFRAEMDLETLPHRYGSSPFEALPFAGDCELRG